MWSIFMFLSACAVSAAAVACFHIKYGSIAAQEEFRKKIAEFEAKMTKLDPEALNKLNDHITALKVKGVFK